MERESIVPCVRLVRAIYDYVGENNDELCLKKGDVITVTQTPEGGWFEGTLRGMTGWFPCNYVQPVFEEDNDNATEDATLLSDNCNFAIDGQGDSFNIATAATDGADGNSSLANHCRVTGKVDQRILNQVDNEENRKQVRLVANYLFPLLNSIYPGDQGDHRFGSDVHQGTYFDPPKHPHSAGKVICVSAFILIAASSFN